MAIVPKHDQETEPDWSRLLSAMALSQDRQVFARLFAHFAPRVKRYLMLAGSPEAQAEELAQEALAAVWRKAALFDPARAAASTWIFTIARHLRVDALRRHQCGADDEPFDCDELEGSLPAAEDCVQAAQLNERLRRALALLPPEQRRVLQLSYFDEEPHPRIAAELGIPLGTVKSRMRLAVAQLRRLLEQ